MARGFCKTAKKERYRDNVSALLNMERIKRKKGHLRESEPKRAYHCPSCGGWHLTSKDLRESSPV